MLKILNASIAVLALLLLFAVYWYAYRPLPRTSGSLRAPVSAPARVLHDARGVPHIQAASWSDAVFLQGFVTAQDRFWQMDALRRLASGTLSEIIGPATVEADLEARRLRLWRLAVAHYRLMPAADRAILEAYSRGVNFYLEQRRDRLPLEFHLLGYKPRPWTPVDSILCALQMYRTLTETWRDDLRKQAMLSGGDASKVNQLFPTRSGRELQPGSNAWVISGRHTASGKPILANDPHLDYTIPATWYQVHLQAPDLDVTGVSLPGIPCVIIGHNRNIAWGVTNLGYDVQDLYLESLDPKTGKYRFADHVEQASLERDTIAVRGSKPIVFEQWVTRHGPVIVREGNQFIAMRWAAAEAGAFEFPFLDLDRASNWSEFTAALKRFPGPGQNFVYADTAGNIGYHATGRLPIRPNFDGDVVLDGSSGKYEWFGFIPFEQLPSFFNPSGGVIVTANQNPFPSTYSFRVSGLFAPPDRSNQIRALLTAHDQWTPPAMLNVQKDVYSPFCYFLAQQLIVAAGAKHPANPEIAEAVSELRRWNGQMEIGQASPMLITLVYLHLRATLANIASPGKGDAYSYQMAPAVVQNILAGGARGWVANKDKLLLDALTASLADGARLQSANLHRWDYGQFHNLLIENPVDGKIPLLGRYFNVGPLPMSGSSTTVKQVNGKLGPSMRFIADLSGWDNSLNNITTGESGHILSPHYKDQWTAYYYATSFPMQFTHVAAEHVLTVTPSK